MNVLAGLILSVSLSADQTPIFADCNGVNESELVGTLQGIVLVVELLDSVGGTQHSDRIAAFRDQVFGRDPDLMSSACQLVMDYPSVPAVVHQATLQLQQSFDARASQNSAKGAGTCLTVEEHEAIASTLLTLNLLTTVIQGACDGLSCYNGFCAPLCATLLPIIVGIPSLEGALRVDGFTCFADHIVDMNAFAEGRLGLVVKGASATLFDIEMAAVDELEPLVEQATATIARDASLEQTTFEVEGYFGQAATQLGALNDQLMADAQRRVDFVGTLALLELETLLLNEAGEVPIEATLPQQFGGGLETVREIVADSLNAFTSVGADVSAARLLFRQGDQAFNGGQYADAYASYRQAYREMMP